MSEVDSSRITEFLLRGFLAPVGRARLPEFLTPGAVKAGSGHSGGTVPDFHRVPPPADAWVRSHSPVPVPVRQGDVFDAFAHRPASASLNSAK
ncbi:hypothetical protein GCM10023192_85560 [Amycolatopsis samaneae]